MGLDKVPVRFLDLDPAQARALALADNKLGEVAEWDDGMLAEVLAELEAESVDLDGLGWSDEDLLALLSQDEPKQLDGTEDELPELQGDKIDSVLGAVYELGPHRLVCGDCTKSESWDLLELQSAAVFTSPPYDLGSSAKLSGNKSMADRGGAYLKPESDWLPLMEAWTSEAVSRCEVVICNVQMLASNKRSLIEWLYCWRDHIADTAVWDKGHSQPAMAHNVMNSEYEFIFILSGKGATRAIKTGNFRGTVPNVYRAPPQRSNDFSSVHGATFPVHLPSWALETLLDKSQEIADPFGGSGTTLIACAIANKSARLIELDPRYCDLIRRRWTAWALKNNQDPGPGALEPISE